MAIEHKHDDANELSINAGVRIIKMETDLDREWYTLIVSISHAQAVGSSSGIKIGEISAISDNGVYSEFV